MFRAAGDVFGEEEEFWLLDCWEFEGAINADVEIKSELGARITKTMMKRKRAGDFFRRGIVARVSKLDI